MSVDVEQRIRDRAYAIWLEQGCPEGRDGDHWLQAERDIAAKAESVAVPATKAPRKSVKKAKAEPAAVASAPADAPKARKPRVPKTVPA